MTGSDAQRVPPALAGRAVWTATELNADRSWSCDLTAVEIDELLAATRAAAALGKPLGQLRRGDYRLPGLQARFAALSRELEHGRGFVLVRGLPVQDLGDEQCRLLFWGIGLQLGLPVSQSRLENYIAEVKDIGERMGQATTRAYRAGGPLRFHTDQCDVLGLLCIREAVSGGHSRIVSSGAIHNAVRERRPDLLSALYRPVGFSRQGEEVAGEMPWYPRPIFDRAVTGQFTSVFSLSYIESAQRMAGVPRLDAAQSEALRLVARLADELSATIALRRGDLQFFNNHVVYHARTDYVDHVEPAHRRTQLRLWLAVPNSRPLPEGASAVFGPTRAGAVRGGVTPPSGRRYAFESWEAAGWTRADRDALEAGHAA